MRFSIAVALSSVFVASSSLVQAAENAPPFLKQVTHAYADNAGVKIHYAAVGKGPLIVFIHGFPDFWYSWRPQMEALSKDYRCVAMDLRGYNLSDKPKGLDNYALAAVATDVVAVMRANGAEKAIVVGHDWGGAVAWTLALAEPQRVEKLVICNLPHPRGITRELATNPEQQKNSQYARNFQKEGAHLALTAEGLVAALNLKDEADKALYLEAFKKSDFEAMLSYYKRNYPREPYTGDAGPLPNAAMPVLMFHGLGDQALNAAALNRTWEWVDKDLTLVTVPGAGHWVHHDRADLVSQTMKWWLAMRR
jgi:epoxide hydrolase 4